MKKIAFCINILFFILVSQSFAQDVPSLEGKWYNPDTQEMFVIATDADKSVKGKGVYYSKGNQRFRMLQISTQTAKDDAYSGKVYYLKVYDPKNINLGWELTANNSPGGIIVHVVKAGSKNVLYFGNMKHFDETINVTYQNRTSAYEELSGFLFNLQTKFAESTNMDNKLTFEGAVEGTPDRVLYKSKYANVKIDPNTHKISFNHVILGNVVVKLEYMIGWQLTLTNIVNKKSIIFTQN